ncbi:adenylate/guanylate cyclase domain-containing protein [bacterium]|nr:adenylate/guanylate cyclase domain-containing protein [bacterium]
MAKRRKRKQVSWWIGIAASVAITAVALYLGSIGLVHELELKTYDQRFLARGPVDIGESDAVVVTINDDDFTLLDTRWPFPRSYYAHVIENLFAAGAKLVVIDVQFFESSFDTTQDVALAEATHAAPDSVIHAAKISFTDKSQLQDQLARTMLPAKRIYTPEVNVGVVNEIQDRDGFTRQYPFAFEVQELNWLPLSMKALQLVQERPDTVQLYRDDPKVVRFAGLAIPKMTENSFLINYAGPAGTFPTYAFSSVIDDGSFQLAQDDTNYMQWFVMSDEEFNTFISVMPEDAADAFREIRQDNPFRDKVVFVGAAAAALRDTKKTPFFAYKPAGEIATENRETPGVEVHAHAYQTLRDRSWIKNAPLRAEVILTFALVLAVFAISNTLTLLLAAPLSLVVAGLYTWGTFYAFGQHNLWLALVAPLLAMVIMFALTTVYRFLLEQRDKAQIRGMFSQYVPKRVVDELIDNPDMMRLGGERRRMTCLFTDVAGFTSVSEKLTPEELVSLLNEYLSAMSKIILNNEGIIDKYEGDLIMAEWGAPVRNDQHATLACRAALRMQEKLEEMRRDFDRRGLPLLESRVGINTGDMIVGNMGCLEVFDYTVMGDAVNLASRLEGANKSYGTTIMIGPETWADVKDEFATRALDDILVKGKERPVRVYELMADSWDKISDAQKQALDDFDRGLKNYRNRRFSDAIDYFQQVLRVMPDDGPSLAYIKRCQEFLADPPPPEWDGVYEMLEK